MTDAPPPDRTDVGLAPGKGVDAPEAPVDESPADEGPVDESPADEPGVEDLEDAALAVEDDLVKLVEERDEYLALARRVQADFENFRKRMLRQGADERERGAGLLVEKLLPALDAFDAALALDEAKDHLRPIYDVLMDVLEKETLTLVYPVGEPFDPTVHEAVVHEPGEGGEEPTVVEVLRSGYLWKGKVLRAALVRVRG